MCLLSSSAQVHSICSSDEMISDYDKMFEKGFQDLESLQSEFESAFGDSYAMMDPTLVDLVQAAHTSTLSGPDLTNRRDLCSGEAFASAMRLDQIVSSLPLNNPFVTTADHTPLLLADHLLLLLHGSKGVRRSIRRGRFLRVHPRVGHL